MKNILILGFLLLSLNLAAQKPGNEKTYAWTVAHKDTCWILDDIGQNQTCALQVVFENMTNGYFKLFGKSGKATQWVQYGSSTFTQGTDSINIVTVLSAGLSSSGWIYDTPILNNMKCCFYHVTDTIGTITLYETLTRRQ
jgi:hypothetical protein